MRTRRAAALLAAAGILAAACAARPLIDDEAAYRALNGLRIGASTQTDVEARFGNPAWSATSVGREGQVTVWTYRWTQLAYVAGYVERRGALPDPAKVAVAEGLSGTGYGGGTVSFTFVDRRLVRVRSAG